MFASAGLRKGDAVILVSGARGNHRRVRIFGEMVSLLYTADNIPAAEGLEEFGTS